MVFMMLPIITKDETGGGEVGTGLREDVLGKREVH